MRRNRWLLYAPLALASLVLLVSACSGGGDDDATSTPTESVTAEATSTAATTATESATSTVEATGTTTSAATSTSTPESTSTATSTSTSTAASSTSSPGAGDNDYETEIEDLAFEQGITVAVGTTVRWKNRDSVQHTVTADGGSFDSGLLATNEEFERTFDAAGSFAFHCTVHPSMTATVTVR